jgi:protein involved in polysaccharide export with SLBB domain
VIKINPFKTRVAIQGEVKRPLQFDVNESDFLQNLLEYSGGFTSSAYTQTLKVIRNTSKEKEIIDVNKNDFSSFKPFNGDTYTVGRILDRFANRVSISGDVFRPGNFSLSENMTVSGLISKADGLREDAYLPKATLFRLGKDLTHNVLSVNLQEVINGKKDIELQKEDSLIVYSKFEIREAFTVSIRGGVIHPGTFPYSENMHLKDLVYLAGGLKESASKEIEISRRIKDVNVMERNAAESKVISYKLLHDTENDTLVIQPFDEVFLKTIPGYKPQSNVTVRGEVVYPGSYALKNKEERLSSLVKRSGGLTASAFSSGAVLIRNSQDTITESIKEKMSISALQTQILDSVKTTNKSINVITNQPNLVGINLTKALKQPNSKWDIILQEGDVLSIPKELQTVNVKGQVLFPSKVTYSHGRSTRSYISASGGFAENALRNRVFIVYANGNVKSTKSYMGIRFYPKVTQGADVYVPERIKKERMYGAERTGVFVSALTALSTISVLLYNTLK